MIFQTLDDKTECVGIYVDGELHFKEVPTELTQTWRYSGPVCDASVEYAWLYAGGKTLADVCPEPLSKKLQSAQAKFNAYLKTFQIAKVNLREHCFFDLVPHGFLKSFCEVRNQVTEHVFNTHEKPANYDHLDSVQKLLYKIKYQNLNVNNEGCTNLFYSSSDRNRARNIINGPHHVDYNLFGTVTGRLTTKPSSLPILTIRKDFRKLIKPNNDWFVSLDYNGAEIRTFLALSGHEQPEGDIHAWNIKNIFDDVLTRDEAKSAFFAWLYNFDSGDLSGEYYDRAAVLKKFYTDGTVHTPFDRHIPIDERRALNYLIQSTTADIVLQKAVEIDKMLEGRKTFISHIVHDEIVLDLKDEDRDFLSTILECFENTAVGGFKVNVNAGKNYYDLGTLDL